MIDRLKKLNEEDLEEEILAGITGIKLALKMEADKEEVYWAQWARSNWIKLGDRNTTYFHRIVTQRRRKNFIQSLEDKGGRLIEGEDNLHHIAMQYFKELFEAKPVRNSSSLMSKIDPCILSQHNEELVRNFTAEKVVEALRDMTPLKAARTNGFPIFFFQKYWHLIGEEVSKYCLDVLNNGKQLEEVNKTNIVLIPKIEAPRNMTHYRPISLCIVIYKIISRTLVNRF